MKRPRPARTAPIRSFATLFGPPLQRFEPEEGRGSAGAEQSPDVPPGSPPGDPISRGVDVGYRVIDAYMREGQKVARRMWAPYGAAAAPGADVQQRLTAMFRQTADLASMWFDLSAAMGIPGLGGPDSRPPGAPTAGPFSTGKPPARPPEPEREVRAPSPPLADEPTAAVSLQIDSRRPVEVLVDLRPRSAGSPLRVHDLRDLDPDKPRLRGATVEVTAEGVRVRIVVPDDLPEGTYSGVVLDERTSLPRGVLSVRVPGG